MFDVAGALINQKGRCGNIFREKKNEEIAHIANCVCSV